MQNNDIKSFSEAAQFIGLGLEGLRVEALRTDGTSNYLTNLNYRGQTWAAALRMPAKGLGLDEFLDDKRRALGAVAYLLNLFSVGADVGSHCIFKFGGISTLVDAQSTKQFLAEQRSSGALTLDDRIGTRTKIVEGFNYPDAVSDDTRAYVTEYDGPFYLSRGAPAWETLENYPELEEPTAHALAHLHARTGTGTPVLQSIALAGLENIKREMHARADQWQPLEGSKEALALAKSMKKWSGDTDPARAETIKRERFLRTSAGREVYTNLFKESVVSQASAEELHSFCHGDSHGGNFILVRYQYAWDADHDLIVDREFLNEIFTNNPTIDAVQVSIDPSGSHVIFELPQTDSTAPIARRALHHEIHPIDLDTGTGIEPATKVLHLYDALIFCMSLENITTLASTRVGAESVLNHYYDRLLSEPVS